MKPGISIVVAAAVALVAACGHSGSSAGNGPDGGSNGSGVTDAMLDAWRGGGMCTPGGPACSNCIDDDGDGLIDGFDPECTGPADNDEATFSTGIPGDNKDPVDQDCFFDGDSGSGNDGCSIHVCCLLGAKTVAECPIGASRYNPDACPPPIGKATLSPQCIETCGKLTPPGCDCFGCCTICDPATNQCYDIEVNPADSPSCSPSTIGDPNSCLRCTKIDSCGTPACGGETCVLCPGQDASDLPPSCNGTSTCPNNETPCTTSDQCSDTTYCSNGCCIGVIF